MSDFMLRSILWFSDLHPGFEYMRVPVRRSYDRCTLYQTAP